MKITYEIEQLLRQLRGSKPSERFEKYKKEHPKTKKTVSDFEFHDSSSLPGHYELPNEHQAPNDDGDNPVPETGYNHRLNTVDDTYYATHKGKVVGHLGFDSSGKVPSVKAVYVDPEHRGKGLSMGMYERAMKDHDHFTSDELSAMEPEAKANWEKLMKKYPDNVYKTKQHYVYST